MKLKHLKRAQSFGNGVAECFEEEAMPALIAPLIARILFPRALVLEGHVTVKIRVAKTVFCLNKSIVDFFRFFLCVLLEVLPIKTMSVQQFFVACF